MPTISLPQQPNLDHLRHQARALQRAAAAGDAAALARIARHAPGGPPTLSRAQLAVAREYGFASWARLRRHLDVVARYRRDPDPRGVEAEDAAVAVVRLACLNYDDDAAYRWDRAGELLAAEPDLPRRDIWVAAAVADAAAVAAHLAAEPDLARRDGGPYRVTPLFTLAYSRLAQIDPLGTAAILLRAGADPNAGYLWHGLPTPFTVLTGALGEGEQGPDRQPRHPHWYALAQLLLDAGADANDGQGLYNRMFVPGTEHLELLFAHGLGQGDGGPWRARLADAVDDPAALLRAQLHWALTHHHGDRVRLLAEHGVDVRTALAGGRTPVELASLAGDPGSVAVLVAHGAAPPRLSDVDELAAAGMAGDAATARRLLATDPGLAGRARAAFPALVLAAAAASRPAAVALLARIGFDVNGAAGPGSGYVPGETALHRAAFDGDRELVEVLLALGADPTRRDRAHRNTPAGWAEHAGHRDVARRLS